MTTKRLRIFAGPNGSGKSTITAIVRNAGIHLGKYINADELKGGINETLRFDFATYLPVIDQNDFWARFSQSALFGKADDWCSLHRMAWQAWLHGQDICTRAYLL